MARWYAFIPMSIFTYQIYLVMNGRNPMAVFITIHALLVTSVLNILQMTSF